MGLGSCYTCYFYEYHQPTWAVTCMVPSRLRIGCSDILGQSLIHGGGDLQICRERIYLCKWRLCRDLAPRLGMWYLEWDRGIEILERKWEIVELINVACKKQLVSRCGFSWDFDCKFCVVLCLCVLRFTSVFKLLNLLWPLCLICCIFIHFCSPDFFYLSPFTKQPTATMSDQPKHDVSGVTTFNKDSLKKTATEEKNTLPTKEGECPLAYFEL